MCPFKLISMNLLLDISCQMSRRSISPLQLLLLLLLLLLSVSFDSVDADVSWQHLALLTAAGSPLRAVLSVRLQPPVIGLLKNTPRLRGPEAASERRADQRPAAT